MNNVVESTASWADAVIKAEGAKPKRGDPSKPPPGYTPIPGSKHNGYHAHIGGVWRTWYPGIGNQLHGSERFTQDEHQKEHDAFRATPAGRKHTAKEAIDALGGEKSGDLSPHAQKALAHLQERVRVYEAGKAPKKPAGQPKNPAEWRKALGDIELNKYPPPEATDIKVSYDAQDPHKKAAVTWRDSKGRVQAAYTPEFARRSAAKKFARIVTLVPLMDKARAKIRSSIGKKAATPRERDTALSLALIEATGLRPGSRVAAKKAKDATFGVTSLRPEHVKENEDGTLELSFVGKASKSNTRTIDDPQLIRELKKRVKEPTSDGFLLTSNETDARAMMKEVVGKGFKPKDLRTMWATNASIEELEKAEVPTLPADIPGRVKAIEKFVKGVSESVADRLGNTASVARSSYIHPSVLATYINWMGANDVIDHLFRANWLLDGATKLAAGLDIGPCEEIEDEDGGDLEELEAYPLSLVRDYMKGSSPKAGESDDPRAEEGPARGQGKDVGALVRRASASGGPGGAQPVRSR